MCKATCRKSLGKRAGAYKHLHGSGPFKMPDFSAGYKYVKEEVKKILTPTPPPPKKNPRTLIEAERKQGAGFGQADIGE